MARVRRAMRRTLALWLLLFGVYASTIGLDAFGGSDYGGDEPHYLLAAKSLVDDGDVDVSDEYVQRAYAAFYPHELEPAWTVTTGAPERAARGRLPAPDRAGVRARAARTAVELSPGGDRGAGARARVPAGAARGAGPVGAGCHARRWPQPAARWRTARRCIPSWPRRPLWRARRCCAVGLDRARRAGGGACFLLLGALPWLGPKFVPAGLVIGAFAPRHLARAASDARRLAVEAVAVLASRSTW